MVGLTNVHFFCQKSELSAGADKMLDLIILLPFGSEGNSSKHFILNWSTQITSLHDLNIVKFPLLSPLNFFSLFLSSRSTLRE